MNLLYVYAPIVSLIFFFGFFVWVAYRAYRPSVRNILQNHAFIPLKEENGHE
jgi:cbb3-type cytochrome oxidase subunit 3